MRRRCEDKVAYLCERTATNAAYLINLRNVGEADRELQTPYECLVCGDWHLTSNPTMPDGLPARSSARNAACSSTSRSGPSSLPAIGSPRRSAPAYVVLTSRLVRSRRHAQQHRWQMRVGRLDPHIDVPDDVEAWELRWYRRGT